MSDIPLNASRSEASPTRSIARLATTYMHSDSVNNANARSPPAGDNNTQPSTWLDSLSRLDRLLSGSLLLLGYNIIDIVLLSIGLYHGTKTCAMSNALVVIAICILIFSGLELASICLYFKRNWSSRDTLSTETLNTNGYPLRNLLHFIRFVCICVGTGFVFTSRVPANNSCEILRFYLGTVCFNTWVLFFNGPPRASLPVRRSVVSECLIVVLSSIVNAVYFGVVLSAALKTQATDCDYTGLEDLYFRAPLQSYAYVGLFLVGCSTADLIINGIINQLYYRLNNLRKFFLAVSAIRYAISYLIAVAMFYYFSTGAVLLFQPRSGGSCRAAAPHLYKTLLVWQFLRVFWPLIFWPLACMICCLGVTIGACLAGCLPASITVPLLEMLQQRFPAGFAAANADPPASPDTIEALPQVVFGQASDEFSQTECVICKVDYEPNEEVKKLPCGHLFHAECVAKWLATTRICPTCRHRVTSSIP